MESIFLLISASFLGALHALEPGHGKSVVAAYMIGNRGSITDAIKLGFVVTITHTLGVFLLGALAFFIVSQIFQGQVERYLQVLSSLMVVAVGLYLLFKKQPQSTSVLFESKGADTTEQEQLVTVAAGNTGSSEQEYELGHEHDCCGHGHGHFAKLLPSGESSDKQGSKSKEIMFLGLSGGLVPCHGALAVLLSALANDTAGKLAFGLAQVLCFSLGMGLVITSLAIAASRLKHYVSDLFQRYNSLAAGLPKLTAVLILVMGLVMTYQNIVCPHVD
jgi:nickel/cobalt exporter